MSLYGNDRIGSGHSAKELNAADWWIRNQPTLKKAGYGALAGFIILTWGYGIWTLFDAYALSYPVEQRYTARIATTELATDALTISAPLPLQPGGAQTLTPEPKLQRLYAPINNPNTLWWAVIEYRFRDGENLTPLRTAVLLPGETRIVGELGWQGAPLRTPSLSIETTEWRRIDPTLVRGDYGRYKEDVLRFNVTGAKYQNDLTIEDKKLGQTTFTVENPTGYAYRDVELMVLLYRNGTVAGVNTLIVPRVEPGFKQEFQMVWPENPSGIDRVDVRPFVNILDPETFKVVE